MLQDGKIMQNEINQTQRSNSLWYYLYENKQIHRDRKENSDYQWSEGGGGVYHLKDIEFMFRINKFWKYREWLWPHNIININASEL